MAFLPEPDDPGCLACATYVGVALALGLLTLTYLGWRGVRSV